MNASFTLLVPLGLSQVYFAGASAGVGAFSFFILISCFVCISAAFFQVDPVHFSVGLLAIGVSVAAGCLLTAFCNAVLPDVASAFTQQGLFLITAAAGALVCSVPLVQFAWQISYSRSVMVMIGAVVIFVASLAVYHILLNPQDPLSERLVVQIFSTHR